LPPEAIPEYSHCLTIRKQRLVVCSLFSALNGRCVLLTMTRDMTRILLIRYVATSVPGHFSLICTSISVVGHFDPQSPVMTAVAVNAAIVQLTVAHRCEWV